MLSLCLHAAHGDLVQERELGWGQGQELIWGLTHCSDERVDEATRPSSTASGVELQGSVEVVERKRKSGGYNEESFGVPWVVFLVVALGFHERACDSRDGSGCSLFVTRRTVRQARVYPVPHPGVVRVPARGGHRRERPISNPSLQSEWLCSSAILSAFIYGH
jgi:hypothetical protein